VSVKSRPPAPQKEPFLIILAYRPICIFPGLKYLTDCLELDILSIPEYRTRSGLNSALGGLSDLSLGYSYVERRAVRLQGVLNRFQSGLWGFLAGYLPGYRWIWRTFRGVICCNVFASIRRIVLR
jgi:hypothetical protein